MKNPIDATNKACPIPFMLAKKEIDNKTHEFIIIVDNKGAVENLKRLAISTSYTFSIKEKENTFLITFISQSKKAIEEKQYETKDVKKQEDKSIFSPPLNQSWILFLGKDTMGEGDKELGANLLRMYLYTIDASNDLPQSIICMNSGVYAATKDKHTITTLRSLETKGVSIIVCGTCLDFYHLLDELQVGVIGNMYEITNILTSSLKVVSI